MKTEKDKKVKTGLLTILFVLMMIDFLTTFIAVGFLGFTEVNFIPKLILSLFGFWAFFVIIILVFFVVTYLANLNYKVSMRDKKTYWTRFLGLFSAILLYIAVVFYNLLNIISVLK